MGFVKCCVHKNARRVASHHVVCVGGVGSHVAHSADKTSKRKVRKHQLFWPFNGVKRLTGVKRCLTGVKR